MHSNYLLTAPLPQGVLKSFWRAKIMSLYIKYSDHCLSKVVMKYVFGRIFNDKENSLCFKTNLSFLWKFILDHPSLTVGTLWFGIVLFFSPSLSPRRPHTSCRKGQATPFWPLVLWAFWQAFENDRVRQLLRVFSNGAYPAAFWSQHGKDNLSVFGWLTLNSSKICFVTHSPCPRGLARFPKLFPHSFSSHPRKKKQCFAKNKLSHFSKKDCCCSGIFKPQEFTSGLILANTARCAARNVSC